MASSSPMLCGPCYKGKIYTEADIWCYNCVEGLCSICLSHHERSNGTYDHKTTDVTSYESSIPAIKTECENHYETLNLYCPSHLVPCCDECISTRHSKCTGIKSLTSVVQKTNIEKSKQSVETDINSILVFFDKLVNTKSKNIETGDRLCIDIKKSVQDIRREINKHLDHLEMKILQEIDTIWNQEQSKATDFISEIATEMEKLMKTKEKLDTITEHNTSKLQSFLSVYQIEQQVHQFERYVDNLEHDERAKGVAIKMKQNDEIEDILRKLGSLKSFGKIMVAKTELNLKRETGVKRDSQVELREQSSINNMHMNINTKIEINLGVFIKDMICLMDGRVIVVESKSKDVKLLTADGKFEKHLTIPDHARSVTQINQDSIAISFPNERVIRFLNIEKETVTKVINLDIACCELSFCDNSLAVGLFECAVTSNIYIIDLEGNILTLIPVENETCPSHLVYRKDRLIYSDYITKAVVCIDISGNKIWQYNQNLFRPAGLCTDSYDNIIVADVESDRIIAISKDGQDSKVLISEFDEQKDLACICCKHNESSGYICDILGTYLAKFNVSYG